MIKLLHLSDLHFGEVTNQGQDTRFLITEDGAKKFAKTIYKHIVSGEDAESICDCIITTGDITHNSESASFSYAKIFFSELLKLFELKKDRLLVIPGNHDISWTSESYDEPARYVSFKSFYESFFSGIKWKADQPAILEAEIPYSKERLVIFGFNSCAVERKTWSGLGYVSESQFEYAKNWIKENSDKNITLRFAALHHHILPVFNYHPSFRDFDPQKEVSDKLNRPPVSLMLNASQFMKFCRQLKITAILHGHAHTPYSVTHTNYVYGESSDSEHISRSIAIIGAGTPSSEGLEHYRSKCFQLIQVRNESKPPLLYIKIFQTGIEEPTIKEVQRSILHLPGGQEVFSIPNEAISQLRGILNKIIREEKQFPRSFMDKKNWDQKDSVSNIYDSILSSTVNWLDTYRKQSYGYAVIARYLPDTELYRNIAIHRYSEEIRDFVYDLNEVSLTIKCAKTNITNLVQSRNNSPYSNIKRNSLYKKSIGGEDQECFAVPINSMNEKYPYAVLSFARPIYRDGERYKEKDIALVEYIKDVLEDALRQAELVEIAEKRRQILYLFSWLHDFVNEKRVSMDVIDDFEQIVEMIYLYLGLNRKRKDALSIFLPKPPSFEYAYPIVERGFGQLKAEKMIYKFNENEGLTGGVIDSREFDYCLDHLNKSKQSFSFRKRITSGKCEKAPLTMIDYHLSFVGVPLGGGNPKYNKGGIVINIATPIGQGMANYIESNYIEPLQVIAQLINPLIEGPWKKYCQEKSG